MESPSAVFPGTQESLFGFQEPKFSLSHKKAKFRRYSVIGSSSSVSTDGSSAGVQQIILNRKAGEAQWTVSRRPCAFVADDLKTLSAKGYCIGNEIGSGTFAIVRHAVYQNKAKNQEMAVKIIDKAKGSEKFVEKFLPRELLIWPELRHGSIIKVHQIIEVGSRVYVFMELASKGSVIQYVKKSGAVSEDRARSWFSALVRALKYCHKRGVAHRDIKCDNLLLDENLKLKLGDFGFVRFCADIRTGKGKLSDTYCGSAAYVAPEIILGSPYDPFKADIWSAGVCLFVILNNSMPFDDSNIHKLHENQMQNNWSFSAKVEESLSDSSKKLIARLLQPDHKKRITLDQILNSSWMRA